MRSFLDTNILVYLFDAAAPAKQQRARALIDEHARGGTLVLSTQVLQEFFVSVTRKLSQPLPAAAGLEALRHLMAFSVVQVTPTLILLAAQRSGREMVSFWDALIIECALSSGTSILYSEDMQHTQELDGLRIVNPFRA
ncbi:MAG: PIN domain-containing protein [Truepera sp.]|nr:PIN domain-containing protein [Truepera sp.]